MRRIDFWAGVPLCFLVTLADRVLRAVGVKGRGHGRKPKNILFIQLAEMGTMVVAYPALRKTRELFPDATLHFLCFGQVRSSLEMLNVIAPQHIHTIDSRSFTSLVRDTLRTWSVARRAGIDTVVNLETFVRYSSLLSYLTGAARRVGLPPLHAGGALHRRFPHPQGDVQPAHPHRARLPGPGACAGGAARRHPHRQAAARRRRPLDSRGSTTDEATAAAIWRKLRRARPGSAPSKKLVVLNPNASKRFPMRRLPLDVVRGPRAPAPRGSRRLRAGHRRRRREAGRRAHLLARRTRRGSST